MEAPSKKLPIYKIRHPEWTSQSNTWIQWRLCYEGGEAFIKANLQQYSRRESPTTFQVRKKLTYNPSHTTTSLNKYRNAMMAKNHEIRREGDPIYKEICQKNVDLKNNSMNTFMGMVFIPLLMAQQKRFIFVDAPPVIPGTTKDADKGRPYIWAVNVENVLAWKYGPDGRLTSILALESTEIEDPETGLSIAFSEQYRYMRLLPASSDDIIIDTWRGRGFPDRPCVLLRMFDQNGKSKGDPRIIDIPRLPVVEGELIDSMLKDVERIQVGILNLNSTDMDFLWKGNFPLYVEQKTMQSKNIPPRGTKKTSLNPDQRIDLKARELNDYDDIEQTERKEIGVGKGVAYKEGLNAPSYIAPPTANIIASMAKQDNMVMQIRTLLDVSLVSMATKALEQSGLSKQMDQVGVNEGLGYIGQVCETVEREVSEIVHYFLKSGIKQEVQYPKEYQVKDKAERLAEVENLQAGKVAVRSKTYQNEVSKDQIRTLLPSDLATKACAEIDSNVWYDESADRANIVTVDLSNGFMPRSLGSQLRGYEKGQADKAMAEATAQADALSGGQVIPPDGNQQGQDPNAPPPTGDPNAPQNQGQGPPVNG